MAASSRPGHYVVLHADGALGLDHQLLLGWDLLVDVVQLVRGDDGVEHRASLGPYALDGPREEPYLGGHGPDLLMCHLGGDCTLEVCDRFGDACDALTDCEGASVVAILPAAGDGFRGEHLGRGEVSHADRSGAITEPNGPSTTFGAHRGCAPTLHSDVLLVSVIDNIPNNSGDVSGDGDLSADAASDRHFGVCDWLWMV